MLPRLKRFYKAKLRRYEVLVRRWTPVPTFDFDKVFVIGYNKTGTTSTASFLKSLGLKHLSINRHLKQHWLKHNYDYLMSYVPCFNSFDDIPWNRIDVVERLMRLDLDTRFILTLRDPDAWFESNQRFEKKIGRTAPKDEQREYWKNDILAAHNNRCRKLAKQYKRKLLEIDVTQDPEAAERICRFLDLDSKTAPTFPHLNRSI